MSDIRARVAEALHFFPNTLVIDEKKNERIEICWVGRIEKDGFICDSNGV